MLVAERDARLQVPFGLGELPLARVDSGQVGVGAPRLVMVTPGQRDVERATHLAGPVQALGRTAGGLGVERVAVHVRGAEPGGQRPGPQGQVDGDVVVGVQHPLVGEGGVGPGELDAGPERLQRRHGGLGRVDGLATAAQVPPDAG